MSYGRLEVVGKAICGSTANPPAEGGKEYRDFYEASKLNTRGSNGLTKTGLYAIFIPADYAYMGKFYSGVIPFMKILCNLLRMN